MREREFSRGDLLSLIESEYPGTKSDTILPSDYLFKDAVKSDPSNAGNRGKDLTYPRFLERVGPNRYKLADQDTTVRTGGLASRNAPLPTSGAMTAAISPPRRHFRPMRPTASGTGYDKLVAALRLLTPSIHQSTDRCWSREPAVRVIDCVLSLNRRYDRFVVPRLDGFERRYPRVQTIPALQALIGCYSSCDVFVSEVLDYRHGERAATLGNVVCWLVGITGVGPYSEQLSNLQSWANQAPPDGYKTLRIAGFGLAGFQYLRMLFGANTAKPDVHIGRYVASYLGHRVSQMEALRTLERAALIAGVPLRDLDTTIWEKSARRPPFTAAIVK